MSCGGSEAITATPTPTPEPTGVPQVESSTAILTGTPTAEENYLFGVAARASGDLEAALDAFDVAIKLDPSHAEAYNDRGAAYFHLGQFAPALADFEHAIALDPEYVKPYLNRGAVYVEPGQLDDLSIAVTVEMEATNQPIEAND